MARKMITVKLICDYDNGVKISECSQNILREDNKRGEFTVKPFSPYSIATEEFISKNSLNVIHRKTSNFDNMSIFFRYIEGECKYDDKEAVYQLLRRTFINELSAKQQWIEEWWESINHASKIKVEKVEL